mmetsp:Transcript_35574/g.76924  ORF Transcript_35574/g.76924 Transcript_35574/m.76924 type:complete len:81 (+) Transcript_35574:633-875(+)
MTYDDMVLDLSKLWSCLYINPRRRDFPVSIDLISVPRCIVCDGRNRWPFVATKTFHPYVHPKMNRWVRKSLLSFLSLMWP